MNLFDTAPPTLTLRDYQRIAVARVLASFREYDRSLLVAPTGAGKTIMFAALAQDYWKRREHTLILAHREELLTQAVDKIYMATGLNAEIEKAEQYASDSAPVVVGSVQTLMREKRLSRWPADHFSLVVVDEAHHALADSYTGILEHFGAHAKVLGVTATADRGDKRNLGQYFQTLAHEIYLLDLIRAKFLSPIKIKTIPIQIDLRQVKVVAGDYDVGQLDESISRYLDEIALALADHASFRKVLVFLPLIRTSRAFAAICRRRGLAAKHIDGLSPDRAQILADFAANKFDVLCNAMLLTEGYDCPDVDCVVVLRPTKIRALYSQMIGRGTRIAPGKTDLLLLDFIWLHEQHNLIKPAHLIAANDRVADKMGELAGDEIEMEELHGRALEEIEAEIQAESEAAAQREEALRRALKENKARKPNTVDAMAFFTALHDVENATYEPTMKWEYDPPTEKQLATLDKFGFDATSITCKGHASKLIDRIFARRAMNLATPKQILCMRKYGHPAPDTATFEEARSFLDRQFRGVTFKAKG